MRVACRISKATRARSCTLPRLRAQAYTHTVAGSPPPPTQQQLFLGRASVLRHSYIGTFYSYSRPILDRCGRSVWIKTHPLSLQHTNVFAGCADVLWKTPQPLKYSMVSCPRHFPLSAVQIWCSFSSVPAHKTERNSGKVFKILLCSFFFKSSPATHKSVLLLLNYYYYCYYFAYTAPFSVPPTLFCKQNNSKSLTVNTVR